MENMECEYCGSPLTGEPNCTNCGAAAPPESLKKEPQVINIYNTINMDDESEKKPKPARKPRPPKVYKIDHEYQARMAKKNLLGLFALIFSATYVLGFVGLILGIMDLSRKDGKKKTLSVIAISLFAAYTLGTIMFFTKERIETKNSTAQIQETLDSIEAMNEEDIITVTVDQIFEVYEGSFSEANDLYTAKYVEVTGRRGSSYVTNDFFELTQLDDDDIYNNIRCYVKGDKKSILEGIGVYDEIKVSGVISDISILGIKMVVTDVERIEREETSDVVEEVEVQNEVEDIPETREELLVHKFDDILDIERENLSAVWNEENSCYQISYYPTEYYMGDVYIVKNNISHYINYCRQIYSLDDMDNIEFQVYMEMLDAKGNYKEDLVMSIRMDQDEFSTYNWDNMEGRKIFEQFSESCEYLWIDERLLDEGYEEVIIYHS